MRRLGTIWLIVVAATFWVGCSVARAQTGPGPVPGGVSPLRAPAPRAPNSGFPIPPGSDELVDASVGREGIPVPRGLTRDAVAPIQRARLLSVRVPGTLPVQRVLGFFTQEGLLQPGQMPDLLLNALPQQPALPGGQPGMEAGVFQGKDGSSSLVIVVLPETPRGPTRVRVVELVGKVTPSVALAVGVQLAERSEEEARRLVAPPIFPNARLEQRIGVPKARIPQLMAAIQRTPGIPEELKGLSISLLQQANHVQFEYYALPPQARLPQVLQFYREHAAQRKWTLLKEDATQPARATALYQRPENQGVVILLTEVRTLPPTPRNPVGSPPRPYLTILQLEGAVSVAPAEAPAARP